MITLARLRVIGICLALTVLAGCAGSGSSGRGGGYYKDDGPGSDIPANIRSIPDAVPRIETHARANMRPYVVFGKRNVPISTERPYRETGVASWYGRKFHGNSTANGETYDMYAMTAAHPTLPLPSYARVTRASNGRSVIVRINDRGPFHSSRIIDLSYAAAAKLGLIGPGSGQVIVEAITNEEILAGTWRRDGTAVARQETPAAPVPQSVTPAPPVTQAMAMAAAPAALQVSAPDPAPTPMATNNTPATPGAEAPVIPDALSALQHSDPPIRTAEPAVYLQFGAFSSPAGAQSLAQRLNDRLGRNAVEVHEDGSLYRVRLGPYGSRTDAVNAAVVIQEQTGMAPLLAIR